MSDPQTTSSAPRMSFSHLGLVVSDIEMMEAFYTGVLGFELTDKGVTGQGATMAFMTLDPAEHHQVFLVDGRPDELPSNTVIDTPWYIYQPFLEPIDLARPDDELMAETEEMCRNAPGFKPYAEFHDDLARRVPATAPR